MVCLGFQVFTIDVLAIHVGKSTVRPMDSVWKFSGDYVIAIFMFLFVVSGVTVVYLVLFKEQQVGVDWLAPGATCTPPTTSISSEKGQFQKDMNHLPTINFQGIFVGFQVGLVINLKDLFGDYPPED